MKTDKDGNPIYYNRRAGKWLPFCSKEEWEERERLVEALHNGEITLEQMQRQLKQFKKKARRKDAQADD